MSDAATPATLRILHLAASERWTGVADPVVSLAAQQARHGHRVWVGCVPGQSFQRKTNERGIQTLPGLQLDRRLHPIHLLADFRLLRRFCREQRIHIVHCHLLHDHWSAATALKVFPPPRGTRPLLVRTVHTSTPPRRDILHRWLYTRLTDQLICISHEAARRTEQTLAIPQRSIPVVQGAVETQIFHPALDPSRLRRELNIPPDAPVAGIVARMRAGRGHRWLLHAIPAVLQRIPQAHFILVGRGEMKRLLKNEIEKPQFRGHVHYAAYRKLAMPNPQAATLPESYAAMNVSLFLGLGSEGSCRAILEAMACARPVIATDQGAVPEIIQDGHTGRIVRDRDTHALAAALIEILSDPARAARMGQEARAEAETRFTENNRAQAVERIYATLLNRPQT